MTLGERIGLIRRRLAGGHEGDDQPWDNREIAAAIGDSFAPLLKMKLFNESEGTAMSNMIGSCLTTAYNLEAVCDAERNLFYVTPPEYMTGLPGEQGIKMLAPMKSMRDAYALLPENFLATYAGLPAQNLEGGGGYWPEIVSKERRFYLHNHTLNSPKYFLFMYVPRITGKTSLYSELNMPDDLWEEVTERVIAKFGGPQKDDTNNGNTDRS